MTIRSYELGVLFVPPPSASVVPYRLPFGHPLVKYTPGTHEPWLADGTYTEPDLHGGVCNV